MRWVIRRCVNVPLPHILHHSLVAKIKAEKAYELVGWALPTYPSLSKVQDVRLVICKGFRRVYVS